MTTQVFSLPAGTVVKRNGIPFMLASETRIECHPENWASIREVADRGVSYGPTLLRSHSLQLSAIPQVAQADGASPTASSSSLESSADMHRSRT